MEELRAIIDLLCLAGVLKSGHGSVKELWGEIFDMPIFKATMSTIRFKFLAVGIRFAVINPCQQEKEMTNLQLSEKSGICLLQSVKCITHLLFIVQ